MTGATVRGPSGAAAFFAVDRTLIPGTSLALLFRDMRARDVVPVGTVLTLTVRHLLASFFGGRQNRIDQLYQQTIAAISGQRRSDLEDWAVRVATTEILPRVYPDIAQLIEVHRAAGDRIYLVTSSPVELARPVAGALGLDGALGTVAEADQQGCFTGRLPDGLLCGRAARDAVVALADVEGLDLRGSHAYTDTADDRPLLAAVGHPHAVNPEPRLLEYAVRHGWAVHELRPARRQLLVGVPPVVPVGLLLGAGAVLGWGAARVRAPR